MTVEVEPGAEPISPRRKWLAIGVATMILVVSYSAMLVAFVAAEAEDGTGGGAAFALGAALVPFVFLALAFISGDRRAAGAVLKAMGLALLVALPVSAIMQDVVTGLAAGFGPEESSLCGRSPSTRGSRGLSPWRWSRSTSRFSFA